MTSPAKGLLAILLLATASLSGQSARSVPQEPTPNLGQLKTRLITYHDCTRPACYTPTIERQSALAIAFLRRRTAHARPGEKLALVLDIDETSLSNWDVEKMDDFGYIAKDWDDLVAKANAPAIAGTLRVYNEAIKRHVDVFFITGRPESQRDATAANLKAAGYATWSGLILRGQHPKDELVEIYKSAARREIAKDHRIILNIGDQLSDLALAPQAEYSVKLPNPFYFIP
jgi:predicted secreted acid phosphatase